MSESSESPPQHPAGAEAKAKYVGIPGVRFVPSDEELILDYLRAKVDGVEQPTDLVQEADVYEKHPTGSLGYSVEDFWYAFTSRQRKYPKGKRPSRSTGDGRWKPVGLNGPVRGSDEKMIGHKSALSYEEFVPDDGQPQGSRRRRRMVKTEWKMCEFVAMDTDKPISSAPNKMLLNEWVLCRITRKAGADQVLEQVHGGQAALVITEDEQLQNAAAPTPPDDPSQQARVDDGADRPDGTEVGFPPCDYYDYPQLWNECGEDFDHDQRNVQGNQVGETADPDPMVNQIKAPADPDSTVTPSEEVPTDPESWDISFLLDDFVKAMDDADKGNTPAAAPAPAPAPAQPPAAANKTSATATPSDK
ncbi:hypothetical protein QYE76_055859 [Lolium multiflorum]|uniref:NAC domain-containing protein n=1 Tax=Lolium multiflorum TaxID=4521 RepID=A0AAD8T1D2_LOLMU|nr:hypothetical protein QYE76_055859 [Lolium multiflorum]